VLAAIIDVGKVQRYEMPVDFKIVQVGGETVAVSQNDDTRAAYLAVQQALSRILVGLELGPPLTLTGTIDSATVRAAITVASANKTVGARSFCEPCVQTADALKDMGVLHTLREDGASVQRTLAEKARRIAGVLTILADTIWYGTLTNIPPCPLPSPPTRATKSSRTPVIAAAAVGLAVGSAVVLAILLPRLR